MRALLFAAVVACTPDYAPPATDGDLRYPRLAWQQRGAIDESARELLAQVPLGIVDVDADATALVARNPKLQLLAHVTAASAPHGDARVPPAAWELAEGAMTTSETAAAATRIAVSDPARFTAPGFAMIGDEHVQVLAIEASELVVERGYHSTPAMHATGTVIAMHVAPTETAWTVRAEDATWRAALVDGAAALLGAGPWSGVALDVCATELVGDLNARLGESVTILASAAACEPADGLVLDGFTAEFEATFARYLQWPMSIVQSREDLHRLHLAVALLGDGYFGRADVAIASYRGGGWLGLPQGPATRIAGGAYTRTFTKGMVLANPTDVPVQVTVPPGFFDLDGEDAAGPRIVPANDGMLLAR